MTSMNVKNIVLKKIKKIIMLKIVIQTGLSANDYGVAMLSNLFLTLTSSSRKVLNR